MYSPRPASTPRTGHLPCGRTGIDPDDRVGHLNRFHQHALHRGEQQLIQLRPHFVHGEGLSTTPPSSPAIFGRTRPPSHEDQQSPCVRDHTKWTRASSHVQNQTRDGRRGYQADDGRPGAELQLEGLGVEPAVRAPAGASVSRGSLPGPARPGGRDRSGRPPGRCCWRARRPLGRRRRIRRGWCRRCPRDRPDRRSAPGTGW